MTQSSTVTNSSSLWHVYHAKQIQFLAEPMKVGEVQFQFVATIRASDLNECFTLTNHVDEQCWTDGPEVLYVELSAARHHGVRSTSVGDVICTMDMHLGWMVMPTGFEPVDTAPFLTQREMSEEG